jgi:hypothetical protein
MFAVLTLLPQPPPDSAPSSSPPPGLFQCKKKTLDSRGIEPRTSPMLRENHTTRPQALLLLFDAEMVDIIVYIAYRLYTRREGYSFQTAAKLIIASFKALMAL